MSVVHMSFNVEQGISVGQLTYILDKLDPDARISDVSHEDGYIYFELTLPIYDEFDKVLSCGCIRKTDGSYDSSHCKEMP